jgi:hypothetical protein
MGRIEYPTGRALCIGINQYPGTNANLNGCVNDAQLWASILRERFSYDATVLLDNAATEQNILKQLRSAVEGCRPKDRLVVTFSGHGTFVADANGDEFDKADEAWCPYDVMEQGVIADDEIATIFRAAAKGVRIVMISDSCHSGTMARATLRAALPNESSGAPRVRFLPPAVWHPDYYPEDTRRAFSPAPVQIDGQSPALLLAGCQDNESSYDAYFKGIPYGAFTRYAVDALSDTPRTYAGWMTAIRKSLPSSRYPQTPQVYGTKTQTNWHIFA